MKISRFRSLCAWLAVAAYGWQALTSEAGDLARARARLEGSSTAASPAAASSNAVESTANSAPQTAAADSPYIYEVAARPRYSQGSGNGSYGAPRYSTAPSTVKPTAPARNTPTLAPPRPTPSTVAQPYVVTPSTTKPATTMPTPTVTKSAPVGAPVQSEVVVKPTAPKPSDVKPSATIDEPRRVYHNSLRSEPILEAAPEATKPLAPTPATESIESEPTESKDVESTTTGKPDYVSPLRPVVVPESTTTAPPKSTPTLVTPALTTPKPATTPAPTVATPAPTAAAKPSVTESPKVGRATDAAPIRTADPSQPGRLPPLADELEPGQSGDEQRMTIGRTPADKKTEQMFESKSEVPLTPELQLLKKRVQAALAMYYQNWTLNTQEHSPWEVMHAIVAYGVDTKLITNGGRDTTTAIGHLCYSGVCRNQPILTIRNGELYALRGPGVQGHPGQFLAILAQSYLQRDYPLYVGGERYTLEDLIQAEMRDCEAGTELTFKLISLMHYLPSDAKWTNFQGQPWSLDRLVREEIVQPVRGAACGGTHRLMGLSYAVRKREQRGEPINGIYLEAKKYIDQYHKYTFSLQNPDGSFSTQWFVRREARNDIDRRMQTTGHVLEWLAFSLTDEQLRDPRVVKAVKYVTDILLHEHYTQWEVGHLGHGLHALQIYNERVFGSEVRSFEGLVQRKPAATAKAPAAQSR
ncbi:MAG: hypothetical protein C0483_19995 [Pirellula sp.]|nr:hypothetical protein [Pirellula sp.]